MSAPTEETGAIPKRGEQATNIGPAAGETTTSTPRGILNPAFQNVTFNAGGGAGPALRPGPPGLSPVPAARRGVKSPAGPPPPPPTARRLFLVEEEAGNVGQAGAVAGVEAAADPGAVEAQNQPFTPADDWSTTRWQNIATEREKAMARLMRPGPAVVQAGAENSVPTVLDPPAGVPPTQPPPRRQKSWGGPQPLIPAGAGIRPRRATSGCRVAAERVAKKRREAAAAEELEEKLRRRIASRRLREENAEKKKKAEEEKRRAARRGWR